MAKDRNNKKNRMAGEKLNGKKDREEYRDSLLTDEAARNERIKNMNFHEGLESLPENYDDINVVKALSGSWGEDDLRRYNKLMGGPEQEEVEVVNDSPSPGVPSAPTGNGGMNVRQDNDIVNSFEGNRNKVVNNQDNSITYTNEDNSNNSRYYGGSERSFAYGGNNVDTPYDADPQSPVKANDFLGDFMRKFGMKSIG